MYRIIRTELYKLVKSPGLWLVVTGLLLPAAAVLLQFLTSDERLLFTWEEILKRSETVSGIAGPVLFSLLAGYVFAREYKDKIINTLLVYPFPRKHFFLAKLLVISCTTAVTTGLSYIIVLSSGFLYARDQLSLALFGEHLRTAAVMAVMQIALMPAAVMTSLLWKSMIAPSALGAGVFIPMVVFSNTGLGEWFPWSIPLMTLLRLNGMVPMGQFDFGRAGCHLAVFFIAVFAIAWRYFSKSDVQ